MNRGATYYQYLPFFILYFFFNNLFLKTGLLYTTLLVPVFIYWLYKNQRLKGLLVWGLLLILPVPFQLILGVDARSYIISSVLVAAAWILLFTGLEATRKTRDELPDIFLKAMVVNSVLLLLALAILPFASIREFMWDMVPMSHNLASIPRLKLLAYEPSHYGLLMIPVFLYFILGILTRKSSHPLIMACAVTIPLLMTFSFGITGALFISLLVGALAYFRWLQAGSRKMVLYGLLAIFIALVSLWVFWPGNPLFVRMGNILAGTDSSSKGRLVHSFMFAKDLVIQYGAWFGVGPGQIKILAHDLIVNFYHYTGEYADVVRIPNSMGEMLATYGIYGFALKLAFELFFFFRLKLYRNMYSLVLFVFIFIYQFTGSFLINAAEIGAWAFAFNSRFELFDLDRIKADRT